MNVFYYLSQCIDLSTEGDVFGYGVAGTASESFTVTGDEISVLFSNFIELQ